MIHSAIDKLIGNLEQVVKDLENLKISASAYELASTSAETSAEYTSAETSAEYTSAETSAEYTSAETSAEYTSAETSAEYTSAETSAEYTSAETSAEYTSAETSAEYTSAETSGGFFLDGSPPSWPSFKYLKGEIRGNLTKTRTMAMDDKGFIHSLGYKSDMHIQTDTLEDTIERKDQGYKGFIGNVKASDGYTYFLPAYSSSVGKLKRSTGEITLEKKFSSCPQVRSGAEGANGIIYMPSYTKTLKIYTLNTKTGQIGSFTPPQPGFFGHVWGAASDDEGNVYMPPALGNKILKVDKNGTTFLLEGKPVTSGVSGFSVKYVGATYVESVHKVFCLPRTGKKILIINCADDSYEEIDLPKEYLNVANKNKNFHGYLAPDGWLYSAFWGDTKCFRVNPLTYEIQWKDYEYEFMDGWPTAKEGSGIMSLGTGYSTCALKIDKDVFLGLAGTSRAIKLEF
jgi:hypothetical protein